MNNLIKELEIMKLNIDKIISKIASGEYCQDKSNFNQSKKVGTEKNTRGKEEVIEENKSYSPDEPSRQFKPTEEQIKRWKAIPATKKTVGLLSKKGFSNEEINEMTQYEAHIILNNLRKENI